MAACTFGSNSCTPKLARLKPSAPICRIISSASVRGSLSIAISASGFSSKRSRRRAITAARSAGSSTVGVPPPKCRCETGIRAGSAPATRSISQKQVLNIGGDRRIARRQLHVAAAIPALLFAKGHVQIERDRLVGVEPAEPFAILACRKMRREMRRGGIAGVSGNVDFGVFFEGGRHRNFFQIGCQPRSNSRPVSC